MSDKVHDACELCREDSYGLIEGIPICWECDTCHGSFEAQATPYEVISVPNRMNYHFDALVHPDEPDLLFLVDGAEVDA